MQISNRKFRLFLLSLFCALLLCGCTEKIEFPSVGNVPVDTETLTAVLTADEISLLDQLPALKFVDLSGSTCYGEILAWSQAHPAVDVKYTVVFPDGSVVDNTTTSLDLGGVDSAQVSETAALLSYLPALETVTLTGCQPEDAAAYINAAPELRFSYDFSLLGTSQSLETLSLDLSRASHADAAELLRYLPLMSQLSKIDLGSEGGGGSLTWDDIYAIHTACPEAELLYTFTLYDKPFSLSDSTMDLNHIPIDDEGALVLKVASCMKNLRFLDMDSCQVSDEGMAAIRDALPDTEVVWRIWFGRAYSVRTDVEMILASNPDAGGDLYYETTRSLQYCTKVKYLDLGHNMILDTIDFVSSMPDLEVAILAMNVCHDMSPLADCPKLEYLEIQTSGLHDLSPLSGLENLRHLNICYCTALHDISPLYGLTGLERLWIGMLTPIPAEQVEEIHRRIPNLETNTTTIDPTYGGWRYGEPTEWGYTPLQPRYELLREQFNYDAKPYAYYWNDPLYNPHS